MFARPPRVLVSSCLPGAHSFAPFFSFRAPRAFMGLQAKFTYVAPVVSYTLASSTVSSCMNITRFKYLLTSGLVKKPGSRLRDSASWLSPVTGSISCFEWRTLLVTLSPLTAECNLNSICRGHELICSAKPTGSHVFRRPNLSGGRSGKFCA